VLLQGGQPLHLLRQRLQGWHHVPGVSNQRRIR
jgi:hypothetical protein